jgi:hypothetical protein
MSVTTIREVRTTARPRHALATRTRSQQTRHNFPVTITDKSGRVRVVSGEVVRPKRGRKGRTSKNRKVAYRLSAQRVKGSGDTFDARVMREIGTIHQD